MGAVTLWVRSILRRRWGATATLAVLAGLSAGVVGASSQAARRADASVERHAARSRSYDLTVQGCPPDVRDPEALTSAARSNGRPEFSRVTRLAAAFGNSRPYTGPQSSNAGVGGGDSGVT